MGYCVPFSYYSIPWIKEHMGRRGSKHSRKKRNKRKKKLEQRLLERQYQVRWLKIGTEEWKNAPIGTVIGYSVPIGTTPEQEAEIVKALKERTATINKALAPKSQPKLKKEKIKKPKAVKLMTQKMIDLVQQPRLSKRQRKKRNRLLRLAMEKRKPKIAIVELEEIPVKEGQL